MSGLGGGRCQVWKESHGVGLWSRGGWSGLSGWVVWEGREGESWGWVSGLLERCSGVSGVVGSGGGCLVWGYSGVRGESDPHKTLWLCIRRIPD